MAKVMLVEDDNNLREIYEARLEAEGYETVSASDGEEALAVAKAQKPDLVISDVMMPKISGFEMLDILRNTDGLKDLKVIMLTALGQAEDKARADSLGADRYLVKSQVTLEDIIKATHQLLDPETAEAAAVVNSLPTETAAPVSPAVPAPVLAPTNDATTVTASSTAPISAPSAQPASAPPIEPVTAAAAPAASPPVTEPVAAPKPDSVPVEPAVTSSSDSPTAPTDASVADPTPPADPPQPTMPATAEPPSVAVAESTTEAAHPQSVAEESAAMQSQINSFAAVPVDAPAADAVTPTASTSGEAASAVTPPTTSSAVPTTPVVEAAAAAPPTDLTRSNDAVMATAVDSLIENTQAQKPSEVTAVEVAPVAEEPVTAVPTTTPDSTEAGAVSTSQPPEPVTAVTGNTEGTDNVTIAHKKVIQPINDPATAKTDLNQLLANEEAKVAAPVLPADSTVAPQPAVAPAAPATEPPATTPSANIPVVEAPTASGSDVNDITL